MSAPDQMDRHDPGSDSSTEMNDRERMYGATPDRNASRSEIAISAEQFEQVRQQNLLILEELKELRSFRTEQRKEKESLSAPQAKKRKIVQSTPQHEADDVEAQIDDLLRPTVDNTDCASDEEEGQINDTQDSDGFDCLHDIEQEYEVDSDVGPTIHEKLAKLISTMTKGKMDNDALKAKLEKHKRPQNCSSLVVPRVNPEIWTIMTNSARAADLKAQKTQKNLTKATIAMIKAADACLQADSPDVKGTIRDMTDAIGINLRTIQDISMDRRHKVLSAPNINQKYKKLASEDNPITDLLFGDDLKTLLANIDSSSKLGLNMTQSSKGKKFSHAFPKNGAGGYRGRGRGTHMWSPMQRWSSLQSQPMRGTRGRGHSSRGRWGQRQAPPQFH